MINNPAITAPIIICDTSFLFPSPVYIYARVIPDAFRSSATENIFAAHPYARHAPFPSSAFHRSYVSLEDVGSTRDAEETVRSSLHAGHCYANRGSAPQHRGHCAADATHQAEHGRVGGGGGGGLPQTGKPPAHR